MSLSINLVASVNTAANQMAIRAGLADLINSKRSAQSTVTPAEIDAAVAAVTPFYSRLAPLQTQSCAVGELFVLSPIVWA